MPSKNGPPADTGPFEFRPRAEPLAQSGVGNSNTGRSRTTARTKPFPRVGVKASTSVSEKEAKRRAQVVRRRRRRAVYTEARTEDANSCWREWSHQNSPGPSTQADDSKRTVRGLCRQVPSVQEEFEVLNVVGSGTFGTVFKARKKSNSRLYAVKWMFQSSAISRYVKETEIASHLGVEHPNIAALALCHRCYGQVVLVLDYFEHDKFRDYYRDLNLYQLWKYMEGLLKALQYVHELGFIHRDIKPNNFLYNVHTGKSKLVDFGLSERCDKYKSKHTEPPAYDPNIKTTIEDYKIRYPETRQRKRASRSGTRGFRAPEVLLKSTQQTPALDMWSVGVVLLTILSCKYPYFASPDDDTALAEVCEMCGDKEIQRVGLALGTKMTIAAGGNYGQKMNLRAMCFYSRRNEVQKNRELGYSRAGPDEFDFLRFYPVSIYDLLDRLLEPHPEKRITAGEALEHPFFNEIKISL